MQGEEILSQASTSANTTAAEEEEEEEDAGGGEESEEEESDVVRGKGGLLITISIIIDEGSWVVSMREIVSKGEGLFIKKSNQY